MILRSLLTHLLRTLAVTAMLLTAITAEAIPPAAPSNLHAFFSRAADSDFSGNNHAYLLTWDDNALDETGYRINVRVGNVGPFSSLGSIGADNDRIQFTLQNLLGSNSQLLVQFQITAYKYNGSTTEISSSNVASVTLTQATLTFNPPSGLSATKLNDGQIRLNWTDNSNSEAYQQIFYKKAADANFTSLGISGIITGFPDFSVSQYLFDLTNIRLQQTNSLIPGLVPNTAYQFAIRATRRTTNTSTGITANLDTGLSNIIAVTTNPLTAPTNLVGTALDQETIQLSWSDNSFNETSYQLEFKAPTTDPDDQDWNLLGSVGRNVNLVTYTTGPGVSLEWRVSAIYAATGETTVVSAPTNVSTITTAFPPVTNLVATTSGVSGEVNLTWEDNSAVEDAFDIYTRPQGTTSWFFIQSMLANTTRAVVNNYLTTDDGNTVQLALPLNQNHEFMVQGRYASTSVVTTDSNIATAQARHGFTSRTYHPAKVGDVISNYVTTVSDEQNRASWSITGLLPIGLNFNTSTGIVTGTPAAGQHGVFNCPMTVNYTNGHTATVPLVLRILRDDASPVVTVPVPDLTLGTGTKFDVSLATHFTDADSETAVKMQTNRGNVDILLYPSLTPEAVDNFMGYVNSGAYNGVIIHRSVPTFIVQGGAYVPFQEPDQFSSLLRRPSPRNEPGVSNVRGSIAAAKVGGNPDSATHDFFFNLEDNSLKSGVALDNQNRGFTVFARVAGTGMSVVDGVAGLPIGDYSNFNSISGNTGQPLVFGESGYNSSLDRRVTLDGQRTTFGEVPMNVTGTTAPTTMDINRVVQIQRVSSTPVLVYEMTNNTAPTVLSAALNNGTLRLEGLTVGTGTVTVRARDLDGSFVDESFNFTVTKGFKPPLITRHPASLAVAEGGKGTLKVTATGSSLRYQWRRNLSPITGATLSSLNLTNIQGGAEGNTGTYDVIVSNDTTSLTSNAATVSLRSAPTLTLQPPLRKIVNAGAELTLNATVGGAPIPALTWLLNGKAVSGQKSTQLKIPAAKLTDAGSYRASASNVVAKNVTSGTAEIIVVDRGNHVSANLPSKDVLLKAQANGSSLFYQWRRDGELLAEDTDTFQGTQTATLKINNITFSEAGDYSCDITTSDLALTSTTGDWFVSVVQKPVLTHFTTATGFVGVDYDYTVPGGGPTNRTISSFSISGLPAGLSYDAATGRIRGNPGRPGNITLKVSAKNAAGTSNTVNGTLQILPLPESTIGTFVAEVGASSVLNRGRGGRLDMTITDGGVASGKISHGYETLSFAGTLFRTTNQNLVAGEAIVTRKNATPLTLTFTLVGPGFLDSGTLNGTISDGTNSTTLTGYRRIYNINWNANYIYVGRFNTGLYLNSTDAGNAALPQGTSFLTSEISSSGTVTTTGRTGDGTTITSSSFLGQQRQFLVYQSLYKNTGALVGTQIINFTTASPLTTDPMRVSGRLLWTKDAQSSASERNYRAGFGNGILLDSVGLKYTPPNGTNRIVMSLPTAENNARLDFAFGGLDEAALDPDISALTIDTSNIASIPSTSPSNPAKVTLKIVAATGALSGKFELLDPPTAPKRLVNYYGLVIPLVPTTLAVRNSSNEVTSAEIPGQAAEGVGQFLLGQLPTGTTTLGTAPLLAGRVRLTPTPITITTQPISVTVNPTTNVTFTVVATAPTGVTLRYQWRRGGSSITGATSASYTQNSVTETNEGSYDVVVTTSYSRVVSNLAVLTVNNPITQVTVTREPNASPVATGTSVTFSATTQGSGPLTYVWRKDGTAIPDETGPTYTIASVSSGDQGSYSCRVSSPITPAGVTSASVSLTVAEAITSVTIQRSPSTPTVGFGGSVVFTIPQITGSSGPYTYQWRKNVSDILSETQSTYSISFVNANSAGTYTVLVTNNVTPAGVLSNEIELVVESGISNVVASRNPATGAVASGTTVVFTVSAQGAGPLSYQWRKNGMIINSATTVNFTIPDTITADSDNYTVLVSNASTPAGVVSNIVALTVADVVSNVNITLTPNTPTIDIDDDLLFTANALGTGPFTYQWLKDGDVITGATANTYQLTDAEETDSGDYRVRVSNSVTPAGLLSDTVTILVNPPDDP